MLDDLDIQLAIRALMDAADATARDFASKDVAGEEDFSGQLIGRFKGKIEN
jgi:hypothetical protein